MILTAVNQPDSGNGILIRSAIVVTGCTASIQQTTADKHLLNYQTSFSQSDLRMDIYAGRDKDLTEFDILDNHGRKVEVGCLQKISNGLKNLLLYYRYKSRGLSNFDFCTWHCNRKSGSG